MLCLLIFLPPPPSRHNSLHHLLRIYHPTLFCPALVSAGATQTTMMPSPSSQLPVKEAGITPHPFSLLPSLLLSAINRVVCHKTMPAFVYFFSSPATGCANIPAPKDTPLFPRERKENFFSRRKKYPVPLHRIPLANTRGRSLCVRPREGSNFPMISQPPLSFNRSPRPAGQPPLLCQYCSANGTVVGSAADLLSCRYFPLLKK